MAVEGGVDGEGDVLMVTTTLMGQLSCLEFHFGRSKLASRRTERLISEFPFKGLRQFPSQLH